MNEHSQKADYFFPLALYPSWMELVRKYLVDRPAQNPTGEYSARTRSRSG